MTSSSRPPRPTPAEELHRTCLPPVHSRRTGLLPTVNDTNPPPLTSPSVDEVIARAGGKFAAVRLSARRARDLHDYYTGVLTASTAPPQVERASNHPLSLALAEIAAGKIRFGEASHTTTSVDPAA